MFSAATKTGSQPSAAANFVEDVFSTYLYTGNGTAQPINNGIALSSTAQWSTTFLTNSANWSQIDITTDASGNYYVCSYDSNNAIVLCKFNSSNAQVWQRKLTYLNFVFPIKIIVSQSGRVCIAGFGDPSGGFNRGVVVVYDSSGNIQWQKYVTQASKNAQLFHCSFDSSDNVYVSGYALATSAPCLIKFDSAGTFVWQRNQTNAGFNIVQGAFVVVDSSNNVYFAGTNFVGGFNRTFIAKYDSSGTFQWGKNFSEASVNKACNFLAIDSSNNLYLALSVNLVKLDTAGTVAWKKQLSGNISSVALDSSNNIYVTEGVRLTKLDTSGSLIWSIGLIVVATAKAAVFGSNVYVVNRDTTKLTASKLLTDGTANSGTAIISLYGTTSTVTNATALTEASGTGMTATTTASTITNSLAVDSVSTLTSDTVTQAAVTGKGGLTWIKIRSSADSHVLTDTVRGAGYRLNSGADAAQAAFSTAYLNAFNSNGFSLGNDGAVNGSGSTYASWTFRDQLKFFDVVTYTGNGANRTIAHNLGSVPGMIFVKRTDTTGAWQVYHRSLANTEYLVLNTTAAKATGATRWNSTTPTSSVFSLGTDTTVNASGGTYVAYLFAHDAGGFGTAGTDNVISCGSFTTGASGEFSVSLGYEPQYVMLKASSTTSDWIIQDVLRGLPTSDSGTSSASLLANTSAAETTSRWNGINATGFGLNSSLTNLAANTTYIYMAIRRPMKVPTIGTSVFNPQALSSSAYTWTNGFPSDLLILQDRSGSAPYVGDRLRGNSAYLQTSSTAAEASYAPSWDFDLATGTMGQEFFSAYSSAIAWNFRRASGFMDEVCYTGTGVARTVAHNLTVVPELIITKCRNKTGTWWTYHSALGATQALQLESNTTPTTSTNIYNNTSPTSTVFTVGITSSINGSNDTFVAYLFATCPGVSKVGSYTGNGTTQAIACGFTGGARFVLIKRTDSTGDWYVYDTARGMTALVDPYLLMNSTAAEAATLGSVTSTAGGFTVNASILAAINTNAASYIFLAIA
jgi:hypothetical protein